MSKKKLKNDTIEIYRVMLNGYDQETLILSTDNIQEATDIACTHHGYKIYDKDYKEIFNPWTKKVPTDEQLKNVRVGTAIILNNTPVYTLSDSIKPNGRFTGTFYYYDGIVIKSRARITNIKNSKSINDIIGFIDIAEITI